MEEKAQKAYNKKYYEEHKDKYKNEYNKIVRCELCNCDLKKLNYSKHFKTQKHINNEEKKKQAKLISSKNEERMQKLEEQIAKLSKKIKKISDE